MALANQTGMEIYTWNLDILTPMTKICSVPVSVCTLHERSDLQEILQNLKPPHTTDQVISIHQLILFT